MALSATVHTFEISLNDADRGVYQALEFRVARHPSETVEYLWTRVLAYRLEYFPGLAFSTGGLSDPDAPALAIRDLTGRLESWIEVGLPEPSRLHRAAKAAPRVAVFSIATSADCSHASLQNPRTVPKGSSSTPWTSRCWRP